ncbi:MAG: helicase, partial [Fibrobacteres bacterium]|nr:helicase [Fibrobacterota bacterium]
TGEDESDNSELKYLKIIKDIRDKEPELFDQIKRLPKKARTAKESKEPGVNLITYFRRGKLQKFFEARNLNEAKELDFVSAAKLLESTTAEKKAKLPEHFFGLLDKNKEAFMFATADEIPEPHNRRGRDSAVQILKMLKASLRDTSQFTEEQEAYVRKVFIQLEEGGLPKQTTKDALQSLSESGAALLNPLKVIALLQTHIPERLLNAHYAESNPTVSGKREVILSMYMGGN